MIGELVDHASRMFSATDPETGQCGDMSYLFGKCARGMSAHNDPALKALTAAPAEGYHAAPAFRM